MHLRAVELTFTACSVVAFPLLLSLSHSPVMSCPCHVHCSITEYNYLCFMIKVVFCSKTHCVVKFLQYGAILADGKSIVCDNPSNSTLKYVHIYAITWMHLQLESLNNSDHLLFCLQTPSNIHADSFLQLHSFLKELSSYCNVSDIRLYDVYNESSVVCSSDACTLNISQDHASCKFITQS